MVHTHMLVRRGLHCPAGLSSGADRDGSGGASVVVVTGPLGFGALPLSGSSPGIVGVSNSAAAGAATGATVRLRTSGSEGALGNN